jgi:mannose-6-phosphate isomerase-like protein (cupin superfamily)
MTKQEIVAKVRELNWPQGSSVVFGAAPMAVAGLREANDIDFLVTPEIFELVKTLGWKKVPKGPGDEPYESGIYEAHANWNFSSYAPTLEHLLKTATVVDGVPFASLVEVRKWKAAWGRPKDLADVALIDKHLARDAAYSPELNEVVATWTAYTDTIDSWQELVAGVAPKATGCGPVYEPGNPIDRPGESFAIADMRSLSFAEPHYHANGEVEIYIVLTGHGKVVVGGVERVLEPGSVSVTPPSTTHFTIPGENLVLAVINTPPFNPANAVSVTETDASVGFDKPQFDQLMLSETHQS